MGEAIKRLKLVALGAVKRQFAVLEAIGVPSLIITGGWSSAFDVSSDVAAELGRAPPGDPLAPPISPAPLGRVQH
jgi:hypothetical protein